MGSNIVGKKIVIDGETLYSPEYHDDGLTYGYVFKDYDAFQNSPDDVCYIPEHAFDDETPIVSSEGNDYYRVDGYTRKDLERLIAHEIDEDEEPIDIDYFFGSLMWCYPETRLAEMTY